MTEQELADAVELANNFKSMWKDSPYRMANSEAGFLAKSFLEMKQRCEKAEAERDSLKTLIKEICQEWNEDCEESCDSYAHAETCKAINIAQAKKALTKERDELRALVAEKDRVLKETIVVKPYRCDLCDTNSKLVDEALSLTGPQALAKYRAMEAVVEAANSVLVIQDNDTRTDWGKFEDAKRKLWLALDKITKAEEVGK